MRQPRSSGKKSRKQKVDFSEGGIVDESRLRHFQVRPLAPRNEAQGQLIAQIKSKDIVFATGPAGTGKTYVSVALAAEELYHRRIERIVITRPMLPCDEDIGSLPGTEAEKYEPWVQPMISVLRERLGDGFLEYAMRKQVILTKPLMMMRGESFKDCWVILDESQNSTPEQMLMFLSRIGENCKMLVLGDVRQSDLRDRHGNRRLNGLQDALARLSDMPEIGRAEFTHDDIVRHGIIRKIIERYDGSACGF